MFNKEFKPKEFLVHQFVKLSVNIDRFSHVIFYQIWIDGECCYIGYTTMTLQMRLDWHLPILRMDIPIDFILT